MAVNDEARQSRRVVVVTGLSGAGKSVTLKTFEDLGYEAVDNLPLFLLRRLVKGGAGEFLAPPMRPLALGLDIRTRDFDVATIQGVLHSLEREGAARPLILFLDCDDEVLRRRYTETRRRHPLAVDRPLADGIALERQMLAPLRDGADDVIDTSDLPPGALKTMIVSRYGETGAGLFVFVTSFSFARGLPREADLVFDVRFLRNPHYEPRLRDLTGLDAEVADYVAADPDFSTFTERLTGLLEPLLPRYVTEGKSYLTIAVGCTGGRHRSVCVAERLGRWLSGRGYGNAIRHRELQGTP